VPKACSVLLVRDRDALERTFSHDESYILHSDREDVHPVDRTLEYSRPLAALKLWLAFRVHGAAAIRAAIERNLLQARLLAELVREDPLLELLVEPQLSAVCFRHLPPPGLAPSAHNASLAAAITAEGRILLAPATVDGVPCLRACIVNHRTTEDDVRAIVEVVREVAARILATP
jgi:aromatic-L-amino-acid/L-tryptophan decarboxylase